MGIQRSSASVDNRKLMIHLGGRSCIIFPLVWYPHETGNANKKVSE